MATFSTCDDRGSSSESSICTSCLEWQLLTMMKRAKPPAMRTKPDLTDDPVRGSRGLLGGGGGGRVPHTTRRQPLKPGYSLMLPPSDPGPSQAIVPPTVGMPFFMKRPFCSRDDAARHDDHLFQTVDGLLDDVVVCAVDYLTARKDSVSGLS